MIFQTALLYLLLHLLGTSVCLALGPRRRLHLCAALGFSSGLTLMVALELLMFGVGVRFTAIRATLGALVIIAAALVRLYRRAWPERREWMLLARWTLGFALAAVALAWTNYSILTYDSHFMVMMGGALGRDGAFAPGMLERMGDYGIFVVLSQSLVVFTKATYLYSLPLVFAVSFVIAFALVLDAALGALGVERRRRRPVIALLTAATFTIYMVFRHAFYVHTNFGTAAYLFLYCALFWLAEVEDDPTTLPVAFLALVALSLHRIEAPLIATLFLSLTVLPSRLPARAILPWLGGFTVALAAWYLLMGSAMPADSAFLTPVRCYLIAGGTLVFGAYAALSFWPPLAFLRRLNRTMPALVAGLMLLALVAAFVLRYEHMSKSLDAWFHTLWLAPYWEGGWLAIVALAALGLFAPAPQSRWVFVVGIPAYMALILLLVWGRHPYYMGLGDSAARMAVHTVPLAFFYFGLKFIPLMGAPPARA